MNYISLYFYKLSILFPPHLSLTSVIVTRSSLTSSTYPTTSCPGITSLSSRLAWSAHSPSPTSTPAWMGACSAGSKSAAPTGEEQALYHQVQARWAGEACPGLQRTPYLKCWVHPMVTRRMIAISLHRLTVKLFSLHDSQATLTDIYEFTWRYILLKTGGLCEQVKILLYLHVHSRSM